MCNVLYLTQDTALYALFLLLVNNFVNPTTVGNLLEDFLEVLLVKFNPGETRLSMKAIS